MINSLEPLLSATAAFTTTTWLAALAIIGLGGLLFAFRIAAAMRRGKCPFHFRKSDSPVDSNPAASVDVKRSVLTRTEAPVLADDPDRAALLEDLQGNILRGHGRDFAAHIFISFSKPDDARAWLGKTARQYCTSAAEQEHTTRAFRIALTDGGIFGHVALSANGYRALGFSEKQMPKPLNPRGRQDREGYSDVFALGQKARQRYLLDPPVHEWEPGFQAAIHAVVILAADDEASLNREVDTLKNSLGSAGSVVSIESGTAIFRQLDPHDPKSMANVEHFGYVDGRSQPLFLEDQLEDEKRKGGINTWNPVAPLSLALVRDPLGKNDLSAGSFLVFRKLEQNVRGFKKAVKRLADELGVEPGLAGAMAMGRFQDGTPVVLQKDDGRTDIFNDFDYSKDPRGLRCPFQAHTRKTNPRGEAVGEGDDTVEEERSHRIVRRGIPYGGALTTSSVPEEQPESGVGLYFLCYQSDIWEQFEFIQRRWCNNPYFLEPQRSKDSGYDKTGLDPIIGQAHPTSPGAAQPPKNWPDGWGNQITSVDVDLAGFVRMKGGEYFFSPSLSFLRNLA